MQKVKNVHVIKADGRRERFQPDKIINTCLRAGLERDQAEEVLKKVVKKAYDNISTQALYKIVLEELRATEPTSSYFYSMRDAIANLDSESFELYAKKILEAYGYECKWNVLIHGACVEHQVDIIAEREHEIMLVECKRHYNPHRFSGLNVALQVHARMEDINDGFELKKNKIRFTNAWVFTNTKFSDHAIAYSQCKNMRMTGWKYPEKASLEDMVNNKRLLPVTVLDMPADAKRSLLAKRIITVQDFLATSPTKLKSLTKMNDSAVRQLLTQAKNVAKM